MASPSLFSQELPFPQSAGLTDTTFSPTLSAHAAGDMIEVDVATDGNPTISITGGSGGWTLHWQIQNTTGGSTPTMAKITKLAASSSESLDLTGTVGEAWASSCRVYRGSGGVLNYYTSTGTNGSSSDGQGAAISPGVGSQEFTFTQCMVMDGTQGTNDAPSGYSNYQTNNNAAAARVDISTAELAATASSDTPGPWDSNPEQWIVGGGAVWETAGGTTHATSGALVGQGSAVDGTAAHIAIHGTSGALSGQGAVIVGSAARTRVHPSSGDLTGPGASIVGAANRTRVHPTSGDLAGPGSDVSGTAARTRAHPSSGDLVGPGSDLSGSAARTRVHPTAGVLTGQGSVLVGQADHQGAAGTHNTTGALVGPGSALAGTAARFRAFATSGDLIGPGSVLTGSAARVGPAVTHDTSGNLVGPGSLLNGQAQNGQSIIDTHDGFWAREYRKMFERKPKIDEVIEIVQEHPEEAIEAVREVVEKKYPDIDYTQVLNSVKIQRFIAKQLIIAVELKRIEDDEQDIEEILLLL